MEDILQSDDQIVNVILIAIGLLILMSLAIVLFFYFSRRKIIKTELEKANLEIDHQKQIIQSTIITQEEERQRIAQDMHDAISSKLNVVSLNASILAEVGITSEEANKVGNSILKMTGTVLESSRKIAHDLLPPTLEKFGLKAALEELCEEVYETGRFDLKHNFSAETDSLTSEKELHLFRIVQELFNNSIKHSEATKLELSLTSEANQLSLRYRDNGKGFDSSVEANSKGLGMSGIRNRAAILNANIDIISAPQKGIDVRVLLKN